MQKNVRIVRFEFVEGDFEEGVITPKRIDSLRIIAAVMQKNAGKLGKNVVRCRHEDGLGLLNQVIILQEFLLAVGDASYEMNKQFESKSLNDHIIRFAQLNDGVVEIAIMQLLQLLSPEQCELVQVAECL